MKKNTYNHEVIARAISFAANNHKGHFRKGTEIPYILHPIEASVIVSTITNNPDVISAAVLHDLIEDTPITIDDLRSEFNEIICNLVEEESENKREGLSPEDTWLVRKQEAIDKLRTASREAKIIALGDKLSNIRSISRDFKELNQKLFDRFNQKDPRLHAWYYDAFIEIFAEFQEYEAFEEYKEKVNTIFQRYLR